MKNINAVFEDREYNKLVKLKGDLSWHDFIMTLIPKEEPSNQEN
jgi:predicted CopG family antitoxin